MNDVKIYPKETADGISNLVKANNTLAYASPLVTKLTNEWVEDFIKKGEYIKQVKFEGFSLSFIRRDVIEQVEFRGANSIDTFFAIDCEAKGIPTYVDFRANMFHMKWRLGLGVYEHMNEGKLPEIVFVGK